MRQMRLLWVSVGIFSVLTAGFIIYLMIGLVQFEGYRPRQIEIAKEEAAEPETHKPRMTAATGAQQGARVKRADDPELVLVNLRRLLQKLQRTAQPTRRASLLAQATARREEFERHLLDILGDTEDPLLVPAIEVVAALKLATANLQLMLLADAEKPATRVAAIRAKEILDPWSIQDTKRLLRDSDPTIVLATLDIATVKDARPTRQIIGLLRHTDPAIRNAAAKAIPVLEPGPDLDALCALTADAGPAAWTAARALGQRGFSDRAETCLGSLLVHEHASLRRTAIRALGTRGAALTASVPAILRTVHDSKRPLRERVDALRALEATGTAPKGLGTTEKDLHAVLRYHAARCFLGHHTDQAVGILIDLLDATTTATLTEGQALSVRAESAEILKAMSGRDLGLESAAWRRWHRKHPNPKLTSPPPAPPRTW